MSGGEQKRAWRCPRCRRTWEHSDQHETALCGWGHRETHCHVVSGETPLPDLALAITTGLNALDSGYRELMEIAALVPDYRASMEGTAAWLLSAKDDLSKARHASKALASPPTDSA